MRKIQTADEGWIPCTPGAIQQSAAASRSPDQSRRRLLKLIGSGGVLGVLGGGTIVGMVVEAGSAPTLAKPLGIGCIDVNRLLVDYVAHRLDDIELRKLISAHLMKCKACRQYYERLCAEVENGSVPESKK